MKISVEAFAKWMIVILLTLNCIAFCSLPARAAGTIFCKAPSGNVVLIADGKKIRMIGWNKIENHPDFTDTRRAEFNRQMRVIQLPKGTVCYK